MNDMNGGRIASSSRGNGRGGGGGAGGTGGRGGSGWKNQWKWINRFRGGRGRGNSAGRGRGGVQTSGDDNNETTGQPVTDGHASNSESTNSSGNRPPPPKRRRTASSIKDSVVAQWKKKLPGYTLYYPDEPPQIAEVDKKIAAITDYLFREGFIKEEKMMAIEDQEYFEVSCENICIDSVFMHAWPLFIQDLNERPSEVVNLWGAVMHKV